MTIDKEKIFAEIADMTGEEIDKELDKMEDIIKKIDPVDIDAK